MNSRAEPDGLKPSSSVWAGIHPEPYDRDHPETGVRVPAKLALPWAPGPVILMNMVPSRPWQFEGRLLSPDLFFNGARHNVARWTEANGYGSVVQPYPEPPLPPPTSPSSMTFRYLSTTWSATGADRARCTYDDMRPDEGWPSALASQPGWNMALANLFPYTEPLVPTSVRAEYPHTISPDNPPNSTTRIRIDSGTRTIELWRSAPGDRTNEVVFVGLSDGGPMAGSHRRLPVLEHRRARLLRRALIRGAIRLSSQLRSARRCS